MSEKTTSKSEPIARNDRFLALLAHHHGDRAPAKPEPAPSKKATDSRLLELFYRRVNFELQMAFRMDARASDFPTIALIVSEVAAFYGVTVHDIHSKRRTANIVLPRQIAAYLSKILTPHSLPSIGNHIGRRDHTTILYAVRKIEALIESDEILRDTIEILKVGIEECMGRKPERAA